MRRQGTTTRRDQERLRPDRPRRGAQPGGRPAVHRGDDVPRRARGAAPSSRRPGGVRRPGHRPDARGRARRTPAGSTSSASAARSTPTRPARSSRPAPPPGCAAGCTPTSSAYGAGRAAGRRARPGRRRPLHLPRPTTTSTRCATPARSRPCCRAWSSRPGSPTPTPARLLDAGVTVALASDCNPGSCFTSSMPLCIALAVREMGMTPGRGGARRDRRRRRGARPRRRRRARARRAGRPGAARRARATCTSPTGPACRSSPASGAAGRPRLR